MGGEQLFDGCKITVLQDGKVLQSYCSTTGMQLTPLNHTFFKWLNGKIYAFFPTIKHNFLGGEKKLQ